MESTEPPLTDGITKFLQERSLTIAAAICLFFLQIYPPKFGSFAVWWVITPAVLVAGAIANPPLRKAAMNRFDELPYAWRVAAGSSCRLVALYFAVAISMIPGPRPPAQASQSGQILEAPPRMVITPVPSNDEEQPLSPRQAKRATKTQLAVQEKPQVIEDERAPEITPSPSTVTAPLNLRIRQ